MLNKIRHNIWHLLYGRHLSKLAQIASISGKFAKDMSEKTKKPVLFLANARSGTLLYYGVEDWKEQLTEDEREEFVANLKSNENWPHSKHVAYFETAQEWMDSGKISWFVYPTMEVKIASANMKDLSLCTTSLMTSLMYNPVVYFPKGLEELIENGFNVVLADISVKKYPGSFRKGCGFYLGLPGFMEFVESIRKDYHITMESRKNCNDALDNLLDSEDEINEHQNLCIMINPLDNSEDDTNVYVFINNNHSILGFRGIKFGKDHDLEKVQHTFSPNREYVRKRLIEIIKAQKG